MSCRSNARQLSWCRVMYDDRMVPPTDARFARLMAFMSFFAAFFSEAGHMQPDYWGEPYINKAEVLSGSLKWTAKLTPPSGLITSRTVRGEDLQANPHYQLSGGKNGIASVSI